MKKYYLPHIPAILVSLALIMSGTMKLVGSPEVMNGFQKMNMLDYRIPIGITEIVATLLYVYPKTAAFGFYLLCSYMGGAICIHLSMHDPITFPAIFLVIIWVGMYFRRPEMFK